ncbi:HET-domain-containing protein [Acephala macrosclerotiorum]|nr:HET-domain-containing protein [Acephala macrosclerotiorum]
MAAIITDFGTQISTTDERLCSQCSKLNLRQYLAPVTLRLLSNLPDTVSFDHNLEVSSSSACSLCRLLSWSLLSRRIDIPVRIKTIGFEQLGQTETLSGSPTASLCIAPCGEYSQRLAPYGKDSYRFGARRYTYGRLVQPDRACRELVIQWLEKCKHEHSGVCSATAMVSTSHDLVPEYLVDVQDMRVHHVCGEKLEYLALSYVWGRIQTLQLLKHNRTELVTPGSLCGRIDEIPTVVRDAITFTKDMGYKFLWVDTLCICQDDAETKERQIAGMNTVYARATMTLVALEGLDASYGLCGVHPYEMPRYQPMEKVHQLRMMTIMPPISESLERSVWRSRAWTFQEEQFSRRILFFTKYQVYFRCQSSTYCEDRFEDCLNVEDGYVKGAFQDELLHRLQPGAHLSTTANRIWMRMVEDYSKRSFSRDSDRYDAFAGVESQLKQGSFHYPCILGMPVRHLVRELYWNHLGNPASEQRKLRRLSGFPSWSWCGWEGGIVLPRVGLRTHITKIQISSENVVRMYDENGQLQDSASAANPPPLPLLVSKDPSKQPTSLLLEAHTSRLSLDTSRLTEDGFLLIEPKPGKTCGVIYCAHLSPESLKENTNQLECILVASCHRSGAFDPCNYLRDKPEFKSWFSYSEIENSTRHGNVTEVHNRALNPPPLRIMSPSDNSPETSRVGLEAWIWKRKLRKVFWTYNHIAQLLVLTSCMTLLTIGVFISIAIAVMLLAVLTLVLLLLWVFQGVRNFFKRKEKWYLWDTMATARSGKWIDETVIKALPKWAQNAFYRAWSGSPDRESHELEEGQNYNNVVNIILVKRRVVDGIEVCERLAIDSYLAPAAARRALPIIALVMKTVATTRAIADAGASGLDVGAAGMSAAADGASLGGFAPVVLPAMYRKAEPLVAAAGASIAHQN